MTELTFQYRGKDLIKPLTALLEIVEADIAANLQQVSKHLPADIEAARSPPSLVRKQTAGEAAVRKLDAARVDLLVKRREAELFLMEAKRTPRYTWTLTMRELAALYPLREEAA